MTRPEDLARLREALSAPELTRGDWQVSGTRARHLELGRDAQLHMVGPDADPVAAVFYDTRTGRGYADARYIAACSPAVIAALVAERDGLLARIERLATLEIPKERLALNVRHPDCHKAADAFWEYWNANGETHKHGYYESTWGAINRALRTVGVVENEYMRAAADAIATARAALTQHTKDDDGK